MFPRIFFFTRVENLRGKQKRSPIVYFNEDQWANLTRGLKPTDSAPLPDDTLTFTLTTLPGLAGGLVEMRCPDGGPITGADGEMRCGGKPDVPFPPPSPPTPTPPEFCFKTLGADGSISCKGACNKGRRCRLVSQTSPTKIPGVTLLLTYCRCS
jgi:hypothetical protein